jgi:hypothetical protein
MALAPWDMDFSRRRLDRKIALPLFSYRTSHFPLSSSEQFSHYPPIYSAFSLLMNWNLLVHGFHVSAALWFVHGCEKKAFYTLIWTSLAKEREACLDKAQPTKHSNGLLAYLEKALRALQRLASQRLEEKEAERLSKGLELVVPCPGCLLQTIKCLAFSYCYSQRKGACLYYLESEHT